MQNGARWSNPNWRGYTIAAWVGVVLVVVTIAAAFLAGRSGNSVVLVIGLGAVAVAACSYAPFPRLFAFVVVLSAWLSAAGWSWNLYRRVAPYDEIAHAVTIMAVTLVAGFAMNYAGVGASCLRPWIKGTLLVCIGVAVGAGWEVAEFFLIVPEQTMTLHDTITDLVVDSGGALVGALLEYWGWRQVQRMREQAGSKPAAAE